MKCKFPPTSDCVLNDLGTYFTLLHRRGSHPRRGVDLNQPRLEVLAEHEICAIELKCILKQGRKHITINICITI